MNPFPANVYCSILAGGSGTRFWPRSRLKTPKHLSHIVSSELTMLELTLSRLEGLIPPERRLIVTHKDQIELTRKIVGARCKHIIPEPEARNTASALALAALDIEKMHADKGEKAVMISLHADQIIDKLDAFYETLNEAVSIAEKDKLTLIGIEPTYPETGYGYIKQGNKLKEGKSSFEVDSFKEKPDPVTADQYFKSGEYSWNSGLFVWRSSKIIAELREFLPKTMEVLEECQEKSSQLFSEISVDNLAGYYSKLEKIAIDDAVLEKSNSIAMVKADLGWQDIGSWAALGTYLKEDSNGNILRGDVIDIETSNSTIDTAGPLVATVGVKDLIIVAEKDAVLVLPKDRAQDVKKIVEKLKQDGRGEFL